MNKRFILLLFLFLFLSARGIFLNFFQPNILMKRILIKKVHISFFYQSFLRLNNFDTLASPSGFAIPFQFHSLVVRLRT